jgi:type II secretory pathway component PulM
MPSSRSFLATWDAASPSRRLLLAAAAIVILLAMALLAGGGPLRSAISRAEADVAQSRLMLEIARERAADIASLSRTERAPYAGDVRSAVERALSQRGIRATPAPAGTSEGRFALVTPAAPFDAIVAAVDALGAEDGVRVVEATITSLIDRGAVRAELTFAR